MENYWTASGVLLGLWLAIACWAAVDVMRLYGKFAGFAVWVVTALAPLVYVGSLSPRIAITSALVCVVISCIAFWMYKQETQTSARISYLE